MGTRSSFEHQTGGAPPDPSGDARRRGRACLAAFAAAGVLSVATFYGGLAVLKTLDRLPPPPVSGTWCIDSRFAWLRDNPEWTKASVIAVGSSVTWRNLNFDGVSADAREEGVVNTAPCFLTLNQVRYLTEYFVGSLPAPKTVLTVVAPRDLEACSKNPTAFFDPDLVTQYVSGGGGSWWLYFRNLRPAHLALHVINADARRSELRYDRFGSGPLTRATPDPGRPFVPEPRCYSELTKLAEMLTAKGIQLVVVTFPVMRGWAERHDVSGLTQAEFRAGVAAALAHTDAILVDGMAEWTAPDSSFTDPVHLQWASTSAFTRFVWKAARQQGAKLPSLDVNESLHSDLHPRPQAGFAR